MRTKQFKAESKKLLDLMINSIYTHKEIFLRELISNASDALDKLYYRSLSGGVSGISRDELYIRLAVDKDARTLTVSDNGIGMTAEELEQNLGTIAKSGSLAFKQDNEKQEGIDIIGQFGVGFYSAFMVADTVTVESRTQGGEAYRWQSSGAAGYTVEPCEVGFERGTVITLQLKEDTEQDKFSEYLEYYRLSSLVKKYSDYIGYPIKMWREVSRPKDPEAEQPEYETVLEDQVLNSMVPLWRKNKNEITEDEYNEFYQSRFYDWEKPVRVIHSHNEGQATYDALLYIPRKAPMDFYSKDFEKGLALYSNGVLIMERCADLLPDHFAFVRGVIDSEDVSLNISREMLQHDYQLKLIARNLEKKIKSELKKLLDTDREAYEEFFRAFGLQLKYGAYSDYGTHAEQLRELLLFVSSKEKTPVTLAEYAERMTDSQKAIYYACGESVELIDMLPQVDTVKAKGYEVLYLTDNVDEFVMKTMRTYNDKPFVNVCAGDLDLDTDEEKDALKAENEAAAPMFATMQQAIGDSVKEVRFTHKLKNHPVCLTSMGDVSLEMEKVLNAMPAGQKVHAQLALEINAEHPIAAKLKTLDDTTLATYARILYAQARLIAGMPVDNPTELSNLICDLMV
ncbi:MAG: molecular chaperone HtpG [Clostridia bacterium]|nr:molecular chaperone HtpG [Clostridia bacterium]